MKTTRTKFGVGGFTLVEIMIVVAIIGLLAAIAIPNFVKARATSQANACINNLRQLDTAVQQFAFEKNKHVGDTINYPGDLTPYIKLNSAGNLHRVPPAALIPFLRWAAPLPPFVRWETRSPRRTSSRHKFNGPFHGARLRSALRLFAMW